METYEELKKRQSKEVSELPIGFAFSSEQFHKVMNELNVKSTSELYRLGNTGGFYRKTDSNLIMNTFERHQKEQHDAMYPAPGVISEEYVYSMIYYEMCNHEFGINSQGRDDVMTACGLEESDMQNPQIAAMWAKARKEYFHQAEINEWF